MAEPNAAELKALIKSGAAMPDGSFYIRDGNDLGNAILAVGRAQPTNDESELARRNSVRRHIMKRAGELKFSSQIPDTWGPDGSLKHSQLEEFLAHHGIKGMHWGVRNDRPGGTSPRSAAKSAKADAKWEKGAQDVHNMIAIHNASVEMMNRDLERINNEPRFKNQDFTTHSTTRRAYYDEVQKSMELRYNQAAGKMTNPSGTRKLRVDVRIYNNGEFENHLHPVDVKHADGEAMAFKIRVKKGPKGHILSIEPPEVAHSTMGELLVSDYLAHFGRKGMKWGEHVFGTDRSGSSTHPDAHNTNLLKAKVQQHGTGSLSTSELQTLVTRLNVEKQYNNLSPHEVSLGRHVVSELLSETGTVGRNVARQTVTEISKKYAVQGLEAVIKSAIK